MCHSRWKVKPHEMSPNRPETDMKKKIQKDKQIDLFTVFSTFDMDKLGRYSSASREILQAFVWWSHKLALHHTNVCKI